MKHKYILYGLMLVIVASVVSATEVYMSVSNPTPYFCDVGDHVTIREIQPPPQMSCIANNITITDYNVADSVSFDYVCYHRYGLTTNIYDSDMNIVNTTSIGGFGGYVSVQLSATIISLPTNFTIECSYFDIAGCGGDGCSVSYRTSLYFESAVVPDNDITGLVTADVINGTVNIFVALLITMIVIMLGSEILAYLGIIGQDIAFKVIAVTMVGLGLILLVIAFKMFVLV